MRKHTHTHIETDTHTHTHTLIGTTLTKRKMCYTYVGVPTNMPEHMSTWIRT